MSPRVFAGLVGSAEFALLAGLGFFIAHGYVDEFFRQYVAALALTSGLAVGLFQALGLYRIVSLASVERQLPRLLAGWTATLALLLNNELIEVFKFRSMYWAMTDDVE